MSHNHDHNCGHDHDHDAHSGPGLSDNLYQYIDHPNVRILNATDESAKILKPWDQRMDETVYAESDADDQLIIRVPFTGTVKLRSILLKAGPGDQTPSKASLVGIPVTAIAKKFDVRIHAQFVNRDHLDFDDVVSIQPVQECTIVQSREVGDYAVKPAKFSNVSSVTLFFPSSQGAESIRLYYLGFLGSFSERKDSPTVIIYEAQANPADHPKIQGTESFAAHMGLGNGRSGGAY